jgi:hypothetical protein
VRSFEHGETIALHRRVASGYDEYGNVTYTTTTQTISGVAIWPESATEVIQNVDRTNTVYVVALPVGHRVDAIDFITWRELDYEVQGEAERLQNPMTATALQTLRMSRMEG